MKYTIDILSQSSDLIHKGPPPAHVLQRRERQVEAVHVVLRKDPDAQLGIDADDTHLRLHLSLQ